MAQGSCRGCVSADSSCCAGRSWRPSWRWTSRCQQSHPLMAMDIRQTWLQTKCSGGCQSTQAETLWRKRRMKSKPLKPEWSHLHQQSQNQSLLQVPWTIGCNQKPCPIKAFYFQGVLTGHATRKRSTAFLESWAKKEPFIEERGSQNWISSKSQKIFFVTSIYHRSCGTWWSPMPDGWDASWRLFAPGARSLWCECSIWVRIPARNGIVTICAGEASLRTTCVAPNLLQRSTLTLRSWRTVVTMTASSKISPKFRRWEWEICSLWRVRAFPVERKDLSTSHHQYSIPVGWRWIAWCWRWTSHGNETLFPRILRGKNSFCEASRTCIAVLLAHS